MTHIAIYRRGVSVAIPLRQTIRVGAYVLGRHLRGRRALSAGADARTAVPLQSRLRRLRQDRLSRTRSSTSASASPSASRRSTNAAPRSSSLAGGEPLLHREIERDRRGHHRAARNSSISAPTRCCSKRRSISSSRNPYFAWTVHLDGDREEHDRSVCQDGVYDRAVAAIARGQDARLSRQHQRHPVRHRRARAGGRGFSTRSARSASTASPCRRATPMSARPTRSISSTAAAPRSCSAASSPTRPRPLVVQPVEPVPRFPRRQPDLPLHPVGQSDAQLSSAGSGPATCSARAMPRPSKS